MFQYPQILQLDENFEPVKIWNNKKEIAEYFNKKIQGADLVLEIVVDFKVIIGLLKFFMKEKD